MFYSADSVGSIDHTCATISVFDFPVCFHYAVQVAFKYSYYGATEEAHCEEITRFCVLSTVCTC